MFLRRKAEAEESKQGENCDDSDANSDITATGSRKRKTGKQRRRIIQSDSDFEVGDSAAEEDARDDEEDGNDSEVGRKKTNRRRRQSSSSGEEVVHRRVYHFYVCNS